MRAVSCRLDLPRKVSVFERRTKRRCFPYFVPCTFSFPHVNVICWVSRCCLSFSSVPGNMILLSFIRFRGTQWRWGTSWHYYSAHGAEQRPMWGEFHLPQTKDHLPLLTLRWLLEPIKISLVSVGQWEKISLKYGFISFVKRHCSPEIKVKLERAPYQEGRRDQLVGFMLGFSWAASFWGRAC